MPIHERKLMNWSTNRIFKTIIDSPHAYPKDYTYLILGQVGPTGKTWLANELIHHGYKAFELTESLYDLISYPDDTDNYCTINHVQKFVAIVLNRRIKEM